MIKPSAERVTDHYLPISAVYSLFLLVNYSHKRFQEMIGYTITKRRIGKKRKTSGERSSTENQRSLNRSLNQTFKMEF